MHYADLGLDAMHDQGRRHAKRFRVYLEPWPEQAREIDSVDSKMRTLEIVVIDREQVAYC